MNLKNVLILLMTFVLGVSPVFAKSLEQLSYEDKQAMVERVGEKLLAKTDTRAFIRFYVKHDDTVNAYAQPDGRIYVLTGLFSELENEDELAAVLAHEISHVKGAHGQKKACVDTALNVGLYALSQALGSSSLATDTAVLSSKFGAQLVSSGTSRSYELKADTAAIDILVKAGYNPLAMVSFLNKIVYNYIDILQSHPAGEKRLTEIYSYIANNYPQYIEKGFNTKSYNNISEFLENKYQNSMNKKVKIAK